MQKKPEKTTWRQCLLTTWVTYTGKGNPGQINFIDNRKSGRNECIKSIYSVDFQKFFDVKVLSVHF